MSTRKYGGDRTIHSSEAVNVELDDDGNVVAVWFRCQPLAFTQDNHGPQRAQEMRDMYARDAVPGIVEIEIAEWV